MLYRTCYCLTALAAATACTPQLAYQVLETHALAAPTADQTLALSYDFWSDGGQITCTVRNLTDAPVYLDLNRTQLVVNDLAQDYYQDEDLTTTTAVARARPVYGGYGSGLFYNGTASTQSASSRRRRPKPVLQVPPRAAVVIGSPSAVPARLRHCDLQKWRNSQPATVAFTEATSPLRLRQFLTYSLRPDGTEPRTLDHGFWVERISNMSPASFQGARIPDERCGKKLLTTHGAMPYAKTGNMYVVFRPLAAF